MTDIGVRFAWRAMGTVTLGDGRPSFPNAPANPGIWRVTIGETTEHGASQDLRAAMYQLSSPGPTQATYRRVHAKTLEGLQSRKPVRLDIITAAEGNTVGQWFPLDLGSEDARALVRAAAIVATANCDADPSSAPYRAALGAARREVLALARSNLMESLPAGKPGKPDNADVKLMRQAADALGALVTAHDRVLVQQMGSRGKPGVMNESLQAVVNVSLRRRLASSRATNWWCVASRKNSASPTPPRHLGRACQECGRRRDRYAALVRS